MSTTLSIIQAGQLDYLDAWELQKQLAGARRNQQIPDTILLTGHPPTYTIGRRGSRNNLLIDQATLERVGAACYEVDRGGDITFHGPGQLVVYLIIDLGRAERGLRKFVGNLEATVIDTLNAWGIHGGPEEGKPGVWVRGRKIAAVGVAVSRRVTYHGFALNVNPDLSYFDYMIPCGIPGSGVTSIERELGQPVQTDDVIDGIVQRLADNFGANTTVGPDIHELRQHLIAPAATPAS
jgi:lipoate-protein ligase B